MLSRHSRQQSRCQRLVRQTRSLGFKLQPHLQSLLCGLMSQLAFIQGQLYMSQSLYLGTHLFPRLLHKGTGKL